MNNPIWAVNEYLRAWDYGILSTQQFLAWAHQFCTELFAELFSHPD